MHARVFVNVYLCFSVRVFFLWVYVRVRVCLYVKVYLYASLCVLVWKRIHLSAEGRTRKHTGIRGDKRSRKRRWEQDGGGRRRGGGWGCRTSHKLAIKRDVSSDEEVGNKIM